MKKVNTLKPMLLLDRVVRLAEAADDPGGKSAFEEILRLLKSIHQQDEDLKGDFVQLVFDDKPQLLAQLDELNASNPAIFNRLPILTEMATYFREPEVIILPGVIWISRGERFNGVSTVLVTASDLTLLYEVSLCAPSSLGYRNTGHNGNIKRLEQMLASMNHNGIMVQGAIGFSFQYLYENPSECVPQN